MNLLLAIPHAVRLALLFAIGAGLAHLVERWARRLVAGQRGEIGVAPGLEVAASTLRVRTLAVDAAVGLLLAFLYWWETERLGLLRALAPANFAPGPADQLALHLAYASQAILILLMLAASLVDIADQTIPDAITVPGTLIGLAVAALFPASLLPIVAAPGGVPGLDFLTLASPNDWPPALAGRPNTAPLAVALGCFLLWCVALLPRPWRGRRGWLRAAALMMARLRREPSARGMLAIATLGSAIIVAVWAVGGDLWCGLLTSLVGLAASGALVWAVRIVGTWALGREAMGFGDVTLMAMIGSFLGWQAGLIIFFLAPFAGLVTGIAQWFFYRDNVIPYGPFLCLAALALVFNWGPIWAWAAPLFGPVWLVPVVMVACVVMLAALLALWKAVRGLLAIG
ncbi:MAG: prepilin peptidase [Planctomycetia bacterium]|nr:prepilin peptidase [Planctomycetia bacterium]